MQVAPETLASIDAELEALGKSATEIAAILDRVARSERLGLDAVDDALAALAVGLPARGEQAASAKKKKKGKGKGKGKSQIVAGPPAVRSAPPAPAPMPETTTDRGRTAAELLAEAMGDSEFPPPLEDSEVAELLAEPLDELSDEPSAARQMAYAVEAVGDLEGALFEDEPVTFDEPREAAPLAALFDGADDPFVGEAAAVEASFFGEDDAFDDAPLRRSLSERPPPPPEPRSEGELDALFDELPAVDGAAPLADLEASPSSSHIEDELFDDEDDEPAGGTAIFSVNDIHAIVEDARKSSLPPLHPEISLGPDDLDGALDQMRAEGSMMESPFGPEEHEEQTSTAERVSASEFELLVDDEIMMLDEDELLDEDEPTTGPSSSQAPPPPEDDDSDEEGGKKKGFFKKLFG